MKNMRNNMLKVLVLIALCSSAAFADGEMGGGGLVDTANDGTMARTSIIRTTEEGEMGGGGLADTTYLGSVMKSIYNYFDWTM